MQKCPKCGRKLGAGVTRCHNKNCDLVLSAPNDPTDPFGPVPITAQVHKEMIELERLRRTYDLAAMGMTLTKTKFPFMIVGLLSLCLLSILAQWLTGTAIISGNQVVIIVSIIAGALLVFYAYVFGRMITIKHDISKARQKFEIDVKGTSEDHLERK